MSLSTRLLHTYIQRERERERERDRERQRQTDRQIDRQTGRQTDRQTDRHTSREVGFRERKKGEKHTLYKHTNAITRSQKLTQRATDKGKKRL